jgi:DNA-binding transcriptional MerR regulator
MNTDNLFTIGKLAKITGTHVKALRYYDKIGILIPAFVNPENGYRYYSNKHVYIVHAIRFCTEINIPLSEFNDFISKDNTEINFSALVKYASKIANRKIEKLQNNLDEFNVMLEIMEEADSPEDFPTHLSIPKKDYWIEPFDGDISTADYHSTVAEIYSTIFKNGLQPLHQEEGMMIFYKNQTLDPYIFIPLKMSKKNQTFDSIIHLPKLNYAVTRSDTSTFQNIPQVFPHLFNQEYEKIVFKTELLTKKIEWSSPVYEVLCSLPEN